MPKRAHLWCALLDMELLACVCVGHKHTPIVPCPREHTNHALSWADHCALLGIEHTHTHTQIYTETVKHAYMHTHTHTHTAKCYICIQTHYPPWLFINIHHTWLLSRPGSSMCLCLCLTQCACVCVCVYVCYHMHYAK